MKHILLPLFLLVFASIPARSQVRHDLTLEQSITMALHTGFAASDVKARYETAWKNAESARRQLWTSVGLTVNAPNLQESLSQQFNPLTGRYQYYQLKQNNMQSYLTITQPLVFTGGTLRFSQGLLSRNQVSGLTGQTQQWNDYFSNFFVEYTQPLLTPNLSAITQTSNEIALAQAETDFLANQMDLIFNVTESFYTVYQLSRRVEIVGEQVAQNEESYATAKGKYDAGLIPEVEVLQSEVDLAGSKNESLNTQRELARAKNAFRLLLGIPTEEEVATVGEIVYRPMMLDSAVAVESALKNRPEVLSADRQVILAEGEIGVAKSRNHFRMDMTARYGLDRNDTLFHDLFHDLNRSRSASLTISVPLFDWGSNSLGVEAAEARHQNSVAAADYTRQRVRQDVLDLLNRIQVAESRIQVLEKTVAVAQKGYEISLQRFRNGSITRNDLTLAQQRLTAARSNNLNALVDYQLGQADLKRRTLWDFEKNAMVEPVMNLE
ncbi:TolC family protein [bacterium]|nr:MAG: TolC family protein [bacterium]